MLRKALAKGKAKAVDKQTEETPTQSLDLPVNHNNLSKTQRKIHTNSTYLLCLIITIFCFRKSYNNRYNNVKIVIYLISELVTSHSLNEFSG